jgi:general secretion pathway protein F
MALYRFKATTMDGQIIEGEMEGQDRASVIARIQEAGQIPIRAEPVRAGLRGLRGGGLHLARRRPLSRAQIEAFTQELSALLQAELPLDRALQIMLAVGADAAVKRLTEAVLEAVRGGAALSDALAQQSGVFSAFYVNMIRASEAGGRLDAGLQRLVEYLDKARVLRERVLSALIYPGILVSVAGLSLVLILTYVVPKVTEIFEEADATLPLATRFVIASADLLQAYGWLLALAVALGVVGTRRVLATAGGRRAWDRQLLRLPIVGDVIRKIETARFSRSMAVLLDNGLPLINALGIAKDTLSNRVLADALADTAETVKAGRGLADPLVAQGLFPRLALQMLKVGEETGQLQEMLLRVADTYDRETSNAIQRLLALLEPILIVGLGAVIGGIIMSVLVAIVSVNELPL